MREEASKEIAEKCSLVMMQFGEKLKKIEVNPPILPEGTISYKRILQLQNNLPVFDAVTAQKLCKMFGECEAQKILSPEELKEMDKIRSFRIACNYIEKHFYQQRRCHIYQRMSDDCLYYPITNDNWFEGGFDKSIAFVVNHFGCLVMWEFLIITEDVKSATEMVIKAEDNHVYTLRLIKSQYDDEASNEYWKRQFYGVESHLITSQYEARIGGNISSQVNALAAAIEYEHNVSLPSVMGCTELINSCGYLKLEWLRSMIVQIQKTPEGKFSKRQKRVLKELLDDYGYRYAVSYYLGMLNSNIYNMNISSGTSFFIDATRKAAVCFINRDGWMAKVFVEGKFNFDFPVVTQRCLYTVKMVGDLHKVPELQELLHCENSKKRCLVIYDLEQVRK